MRLLGDPSVPDSFEPKTGILPKAQQEIWPRLAPAPALSFVLYGGTAIALHLGHRSSIDFDFFRAEPLDKKDIEGGSQRGRQLRRLVVGSDHYWAAQTSWPS
jgi:hypothetical protein